MSLQPPTKARFREICKDDATAVVELLTEGFPVRTPAYWQRAIELLEAHPTPPGYPRYGYMIESEGRPAGVLLLISTVTGDGGPVRCNFSSWYVRPEFRGHAALLVAYVLKRHLAATFVNISAVRHTWPTIEAQGFRRYAEGTFAAVPVLSPGGHGARVRALSAEDIAAARLPAHEREMLAAHLGYGCIVAGVETEHGLEPIVLRRGELKHVSVAEVIWCRDVVVLRDVAGALGRLLLRHGLVVLCVGANGPVPGLLGHFFKDRRPRYFRGTDPPCCGDLSYTELAMFG